MVYHPKVRFDSLDNTWEANCTYYRSGETLHSPAEDHVDEVHSLKLVLEDRQGNEYFLKFKDLGVLWNIRAWVDDLTYACGEEV